MARRAGEVWGSGPIERQDVESAVSVLALDGISAREALRVAVMRRHGIDRVMTFDRGFDRISGIQRYQRR